MRGKLFVQAFTKYLCGLLIMGLLLFLPAGTLRWPRAWLMLGILFIPMLVAGVVLLIRSPELLQKRLNAKEAQGEQRKVVGFSALMFAAAFITAGLSFRFMWFLLPEAVSWAAAGVFLLGYLLYAEVLRENVWLSRTVEVQAHQQLVDTGLYGMVRHPMYMSTVLMFLSMPLVLGSGAAFVIMLAYIPILVRRIRNEEAVLEKGLPGYADYRRRVRYRLIPFIW